MRDQTPVVRLLKGEIEYERAALQETFGDTMPDLVRWRIHDATIASAVGAERAFRSISQMEQIRVLLRGHSGLALVVRLQDMTVSVTGIGPLRKRKRRKERK